VKSCGAADAAPQRWAIRQRCSCRLVSRQCRLPVPLHRTGNSGSSCAELSVASDGDCTSESRSGSGSQRVSSSRRFSFLGHFALLEVVDKLRGGLALRLTNRFEDATLGDTAEIVVGGRSPTNSAMSRLTARARRSA